MKQIISDNLWKDYLETPISSSDPLPCTGIDETTLSNMLATFARTRRVQPFSESFLQQMEQNHLK